MAPERPAVVVTGLGIRSALGDHATQTCAALRAGLNRFAAWKHLGTSGGPVVAACARPDLGDRPWTDKAIELLEAPLAEALFAAGLPDLLRAPRRRGEGPGVAAFVAVPHPSRLGVDAEERSELLATLAEDLSSENPPELHLVALDQAGGLAAIGAAQQALWDGKAELCLVGGADSLLESKLLRTLAGAGRLKTPDAASGLVPGEAGAWLVLETGASARRRGARPIAQVEAVALAREAAPFDPAAPVSTAAVGVALRSVLEVTGGGAAFRCVVNDLNGERWRFLEWALAETRYLGSMTHGWKLWHPADGLGDVGAAFGPVAAAVAARALESGYAGGGKVLVAAASDGGERAVLAMAPGGG